MRIFVLLSRVPYPLEKGDKLRAFHQIKELSKSNEIILCALNTVRNLDKQAAFSAVQPYCRSVNFIDLSLPGRAWNIFRSLFGFLPFQAAYFYNRKAARKIRSLVEDYKPDHVYCQLIRTAEYVKDLDISKTIDYQDVFSWGVKRRIDKSGWLLKPVLKEEYRRLVAYEKKVFNFFNNKTIISIPDRDLIPHPDRNKIVVVPNGVDHDFFSPRESEKKYDLVFTGNMGYPPNVDAAEFLVNEIMPLVWKKQPSCRVLLAGASPDKRVLALKSGQVEVTGWMEDIRDAYASAKIFIAPMRIGTGLQNKLLEAMSMKIPSITTPLANDALQAKDGEEILIGADDRELADRILMLLSDKILYSRLKENGYQYVRTNYSWEEANNILNGIIQRTK